MSWHASRCNSWRRLLYLLNKCLNAKSMDVSTVENRFVRADTWLLGRSSMDHDPRGSPSRSTAIRMHAKPQATSTLWKLSVVILAPRDDTPHVALLNRKAEG